jgi:hypothetical protein
MCLLYHDEVPSSEWILFNHQLRLLAREHYIFNVQSSKKHFEVKFLWHNYFGKSMVFKMLKYWKYTYHKTSCGAFIRIFNHIYRHNWSIIWQCLIYLVHHVVICRYRYFEIITAKIFLPLKKCVPHNTQLIIWASSYFRNRTMVSLPFLRMPIFFSDTAHLLIMN